MRDATTRHPQAEPADAERSLMQEILALGAVVGIEILNPPFLVVALGAPLLAAALVPHLPTPVERLMRALAEASPLRLTASWSG